MRLVIRRLLASYVARLNFSTYARDEGVVMNKSFAPIIEHSGIINLLNEFNKEAENVIAHLVAIDAACQSETEQAAI